MPDYDPAVIRAQLQPVADVPGLSDLKGLTDGVNKAGSWLADRHNWARIGWFVAGYAMIIAGVVILTKPVVDTAAGAAGKIAKGVL